jgi:hypothetical protein
MKTHDLAKKLLASPNEDVRISIDVSTCDEDSERRVSSEELVEIQNDSWMGYISLLFVNGQMNWEINNA